MTGTVRPAESCSHRNGETRAATKSLSVPTEQE